MTVDHLGLAHNVSVMDGAEYAGETYIRCTECEALFDDGHVGIVALLDFLKDHGAISQ